jgi:hypothetical protein
MNLGSELCAARSRFAYGLRRIQRKDAEGAEGRRGEELFLPPFSAFLRALCVSALTPVRIRLRLCPAGPVVEAAGGEQRLECVPLAGAIVKRGRAQARPRRGTLRHRTCDPEY